LSAGHFKRPRRSEISIKGRYESLNFRGKDCPEKYAKKFKIQDISCRHFCEKKFHSIFALFSDTAGVVFLTSEAVLGIFPAFTNSAKSDVRDTDGI